MKGAKTFAHVKIKERKEKDVKMLYIKIYYECIREVIFNSDSY